MSLIHKYSRSGCDGYASFMQRRQSTISGSNAIDTDLDWQQSVRRRLASVLNAVSVGVEGLVSGPEHY